ncbi:MAG TPA: ABC transporter substrate-binding protein [Candidatus Limnocylindrales bacterium]|nr:ABC transporter substrate-binding protein [Candidatus Limnocylindrales bacterium]
MGGCFSFDTAPTATPIGSALPPVTSRPTLPPRTSLRVALDAEPGGLLPNARDRNARLVAGLLYSRLYRLDGALRPQPDLAEGPPAVSSDGLRWQVTLRPGVTFHDGSPLTVTDVLGSYRMAISPACPFGEVCDRAREQLSGVDQVGERGLVFMLNRPSGALGSTVLAQLEILPTAALRASLERLVAATGAVGRDRLAELALRIEAATNAEECLVEAPPPSCDAATYVPELEATLRLAGGALPEQARFLRADGSVDRDAYAGALAGLLDDLVAVLDAPAEDDRLAAALPLLDLGRQPVGSGPFRFERHVPGESLTLARNEAYFGGRAGTNGVELVIMRDAAAAATALRTGDVDWLPRIRADEVPRLETDGGLRVAAQPAGRFLAIVFNVRAGRPYADAAARRAFARCIDRPRIIDEATGGRGRPVRLPTWPSSWAAQRPPDEPPRDVSAARGLLEAAGWARGADGIYARDGIRLSSRLAVRPTRGDQLAFARAAAEQLAECGIELRVQESELSSSDLLRQLEYPNDFDTFLHAYGLGADPSLDLGVLHSARVTSEQKPGDANIGGWADPETDRLLDAAAASTDEGARADAYARLVTRLAELVPILPLWYDLEYAAVSGRLREAGEPVDPSRPGYGRAPERWTLAAP